jgi:periplasmic protein TonB
VNTRQRLEALRAEESWWHEVLAGDGHPLRALTDPKPHWIGAFALALVLHLAVAGLALLHHDGLAAPSPGTGAPAIEVVVLPAWPEPGHHSTQLGAVAVAEPPRKVARPSGPPTIFASTAPPSNLSSPPVDPNHPPPAESSAQTIDATASQLATAPRTDTPPSTPNAAEALWEGDVLAKLVNLKRYPANLKRHAGLQDTVMVRFVVDRTGQVLSANVAESHGFAQLDGEALALIQRASPLPPPPAEVSGDEIQLVAPIQFVLRHAP